MDENGELVLSELSVLEMTSEIINAFIKVDSDMKLSFKTTTEEMTLNICPLPGGKYDFSQFHIILKYKDMEGNKYIAYWPPI